MATSEKSTALIARVAALSWLRPPLQDYPAR
jgi:hypothetical protein